MSFGMGIFRGEEATHSFYTRYRRVRLETHGRAISHGGGKRG